MTHTTKVDQMIQDAVSKHKVGKESLTVSILVLALTDAAFVERAAALSRYMDQRGQQALEKLGL
jgi:hypothetical protein